MVSPLHTKTYCADTSFSNHTGECWHDSSIMLFCYTNGSKKLLDTRTNNKNAKIYTHKK